MVGGFYNASAQGATTAMPKRDKIRLNIMAAAMLVLLPAAARADGPFAEKVSTYPIDGGTGVELYLSIGERGPKVGPARAIAHTTFDLKWSRKYEPRGNACVLASARPWLTITYTVPKPSRKLPPAVQARWDTFAAGVLAHEKVHGASIKAMVREIEGFSVGFRAENDPGCKKIRVELTKRLAAASEAQRKEGRDFDREEFRDGGNMRRLILALVNGQ
jgi:predicted secreted Zn-dependent protease